MPWTKFRGRWDGHTIITEPTTKENRRWVNDIGRNRTTLPGANNLIAWYREAREYGYSQKLSVRYAIHLAECSWHSGSSIKLKSLQKNRKYAWMVGIRIDASKKRFLKILSNTFHTKVTLKDLEDGMDSRSILMTYLSLGNPRFYRQSLAATDCYKRICGNQTEVSNETLNQHFLFHARVRNSWRKVKRGRDLFILWPFDIGNVLDEFSNNAIFSVEAVISQGYNCRGGCLLKGNQHILNYIKRWQSWWKIDNHMATLDELPDVIDMEVHPERAIREANIERVIQRDSYKKSKPILPETCYHATDSLPEQKTDCKTILSPIRTYGELDEVAAILHNCARDHHFLLTGKSTVIVVLRDLKTNKPLALGELDLKGKKWLQIHGPCNAPVSKETRVFYDSYLERL